MHSLIWALSGRSCRSYLMNHWMQVLLSAFFLFFCRALHSIQHTKHMQPIPPSLSLQKVWKIAFRAFRFAQLIMHMESQHFASPKRFKQPFTQTLLFKMLEMLYFSECFTSTSLSRMEQTQLVGWFG